MKHATNFNYSNFHSSNFHYSRYIQYVFFIVTLLISFICFSQDKQHLNEDAGYFYSLSNGEASNPMMTTTPVFYLENPERQMLQSRLREARLSNNVSKIKEIQNRINYIDGSQAVEYVNNPSETGIEQTSGQFYSESDGISTIAGNNYWAIATQTSNKSQHIFTAVSEFVPSAGDQIKVYVSYNNGISWVLKGVWNSFGNGVRCNTDELDIEPVISGADTMLFVVAGYTFNNNKFSLIARFNVGTGVVSGQPFSLSNLTTKNYNPRVTSDNTVFGNAFVYITVSNDSTLGVNNHKIRQRLCVITNPYAAIFTQTHKNPTSGAFYWGNTGVLDNTYFYQDIAYYHNPSDNTDNIYSASIFPGLNNVYIAWSKNMGGAIVGSLIVNETMPISRIRLAFNGGVGNLNGAMIYLRNYTSNPTGDVDVRCQNTTSGGTLTSSYTASFVEFTSDTATTCDVQAIKIANNKFKFAYGVVGSRCYYRSNISVAGYSFPLLVNNLPGIRVKAGYRIAPTDSCLSIWSKSDGTGMYSTYGCENFTGINQNENTIPEAYTLSQNYPNPFNPVTNIKFSVPQAGIVKLVVYDLLGKQVTELVNQQMNAGSYTVDFNASQLSSGVYFYRIHAGEFTAIKKMMLVK